MSHGVRKGVHLFVVLCFCANTCVAHDARNSTGSTFLSSVSQVVSSFFWSTSSKDTGSISADITPQEVTFKENDPPLELPKEECPPQDSDQKQNIEQTADILPHRATYEISLLEPNGNDEISDLKGWMTIQVIDTGDGWAIEQKSSLIIYKAEEGAEQFTTTLATWESKNGLQYKFNARTLRDGEEEDLLSGSAIMATKEGAGVVTYQSPVSATVQLPAGTVFPAQLLVQTLQAAKTGQTVTSNLVFDGTSETREPVDVNTVIGKGTLPKLKLSDTTLFQAKTVWPMRMAVYTVGAPNPEPEYEIKQNVLDSGVIEYMTQDYGTFTVGIQLTKVEVFG